jgi:hypothetical protein
LTRQAKRAEAPTYPCQTISIVGGKGARNQERRYSEAQAKVGAAQRHVGHRYQVDLASLVTVDAENVHIFPVIAGGPSSDAIGAKDDCTLSLTSGLTLNLDQSASFLKGQVVAPLTSERHQYLLPTTNQSSQDGSLSAFANL